ncbi:MAG: ABC transporter ATP-binding protein [Patescibacteria group bacterium]
MSLESPSKKFKPYTNVDLIKDFAVFIRPYKWQFFGSTFLRIISDIVWLYPTYALATTITFFTHYQAGQSLAPFWAVLTIWIAAVIIRYVGIFYSKMLGNKMSERIALDAQLKTMNHLFKLDMAWHEKENAGNKLKRIDRGSYAFDKIMRMWTGTFLETSVNLIGILLIISSFDRTITLITIVFLITYFIISFLFTRRAAAASRVVNAKEEDLSGLLFESVNNVRSIKVMSMIKPLSEILNRTTSELFGFIRTRLFWYQTAYGVKGLWGQGFRLMFVVIIVIGIAKGRYEVGFLVLFYNYFNSLWQSFAELSEVAQEFIIAKISIARLTDILQTPLTIDNESNKVPFPKDWKKIRISNLSFAYGDKKVLDNISFDINRGERIGIVGLSGAGKSTLFKMLLKEHESYTGNIFIDDVPLNTISKTDYFKHLAVVLQETEVFDFTLRENITITNHDEANNEELFNKSTDIAHVTDFARKLPNGADTMIGEKGVKLSGGEKQRVGIARAVFKNPQILLLDEATSHLDIESEEKIRDSLHQFFQTVTAVVIAHRLTTIKEMDRIFVLEYGKVIESGNFKELHAQKGRFYDLWEKQKL